MFVVPELGYGYGALEPYVDEQTMLLHHGKHHALYVKNLNDALSGHEDLLSMGIEELMSDLGRVPETVRLKVRKNGGGHLNHSLFWRVMGVGALKMEGKLKEAVERTFSGMETMVLKFSEAAMGRFGSGWAWLTVDQGNLRIESTANQDSPLMEGRVPILGLDVWEHAYYLKYQNMRGEYVKAWWNVVNWKEVGKRFEDAVFGARFKK